MVGMVNWVSDDVPGLSVLTVMTKSFVGEGVLVMVRFLDLLELSPSLNTTEGVEPFNEREFFLACPEEST